MEVSVKCNRTEQRGRKGEAHHVLRWATKFRRTEIVFSVSSLVYLPIFAIASPLLFCFPPQFDVIHSLPFPFSALCCAVLCRCMCLLFTPSWLHKFFLLHQTRNKHRCNIKFDQQQWAVSQSNRQSIRSLKQEGRSEFYNILGIAACELRLLVKVVH